MGRDSHATVLLASMWQETNTYSPRITTLDDFKRFELLEGEEVGAAHAGVRSVIGGAIDVLGAHARFGLSAGAWPAGPADESVARALLDRFADTLNQHRDCAGVLLNLHGAMVASGYPDLELEVVERVKRQLGDIPIVTVLDYHANPSREFIAGCDAVVAYTTYPHVDMFERGRQAAEILLSILRHERRGRVVLRKMPLLTSPLAQGTHSVHVTELLHAHGQLVTSLGGFVTPGFPYSDVARAGMSIGLNKWADDPVHAQSLDTLAAGVLTNRDLWSPNVTSVEGAMIEAAVATERLMLADVGDNIGGGSPGDGTALLEGLLRLRSRRSLVMITDPQVVEEATAVGVGGSIDVAIGARTDALHGAPVRTRVEVVSLSDGTYRALGEWMGGMEFSMGPTAVVRAQSVTIIVTSVANPPFHVEQVTSQGLALESFDILTAKGALAWQDGYGPLVGRAIFVDTPGVTPAHPERLLRHASFAEGNLPWIHPQTLGLADE